MKKKEKEEEKKMFKKNLVLPNLTGEKNNFFLGRAAEPCRKVDLRKIVFLRAAPQSRVADQIFCWEAVPWSYAAKCEAISW